MALFALLCVLRGFPPSTYLKYASGKNPCAALIRTKIAHFWIGNRSESLIFHEIFRTTRIAHEPNSQDFPEKFSCNIRVHQDISQARGVHLQGIQGRRCSLLPPTLDNTANERFWLARRVKIFK